MEERQAAKRKIGVFLLTGLVLSGSLYGVIIGRGYGINSGSVFSLGLMWVPGVSALVSKLLVDHSVRGIGWRLRRKTLPPLGAAYLIPPMLCMAVYGLAWAVGIGRCGIIVPMQVLSFATLGVLLSCAASLGEEIGWRGFLLTELRKVLPPRMVHLVIGSIWFFYHAPVIVFSNYNNGNIPVSLVCFFVMVQGMTVLADVLCIRAESFWPAVLLPASHNVFVQSIFDPLTENGPWTQLWTSEFGLGLAIAYAAACAVLFLPRRRA